MTADSILVWFGYDRLGDLHCEIYKGAGTIHKIEITIRTPDVFSGPGFIIKFYSKTRIDLFITNKLYQLQRL
jgi:hypothetical protein